MTAKSTPLDLIAIRQHILAELGVVAWALKTDDIHINPKTYQSRLMLNSRHKTFDNQSAIEKVVDNKVVDNSIATSKQSPSDFNINANGNNKNIHNDLNHKTINKTFDNGTIPEANTQSLEPEKIPMIPTIQATLPERFVGIEAKVERFELFGLSYQNWVILVDNNLMTAQQKSIWTSLVDKLSTEGAFYLQVHYPLVANEYREYENFAQGTHSLLGFLLRLCANKPSLKLALLTPLSNGIALGNLTPLIEMTPTLQEMGQNPQAKKTFWQLLHS